MNLYLIGPMGAGKTTVGRALARRLRRRFVDSDHAIVDKCGVDIPTIFEFEGEAGFRERERAIIDELAAEQDIVVATGGGAVLDADNRAAIRRSGLVIYLAISVDEQLLRTRRDRNRPLLQTANPRQRLQALAKARNPIYAELADLSMSTDGMGAMHVVNQLLGQLKQHPTLHLEV